MLEDIFIIGLVQLYGKKSCIRIENFLNSTINQFSYHKRSERQILDRYNQLILSNNFESLKKKSIEYFEPSRFIIKNDEQETKNVHDLFNYSTNVLNNLSMIKDIENKMEVEESEHNEQNEHNDGNAPERLDSDIIARLQDRLSVIASNSMENKSNNKINHSFPMENKLPDYLMFKSTKQNISPLNF